MKKNNVIFLLIFTWMIMTPFLWGNENENQYVVSLPEGKLPWPHHRPNMSQAEYDQLMANLWIFNNFGQYQASVDKSNVYFHGALDVMLPNGTRLYAIEAGYVKEIDYNNPGYDSIAIADTEGTQPGSGWNYVHTTNFQFEVGDYVKKGDYICDVYFEGMEHVHLGKIFVENEAWHRLSSYNYVYPNSYFIYEDTVPPVIKVPFHFFPNQTDTLYDNTIPPTVHGDVDIVVGIREAGEYAHEKPGGLGDRLCVARIEYEISGENIQPVYKQSFDFTRMVINGQEDDSRSRVYTVFKHYTLFHAVINNSFWDKTFSYYILTNTDGPPQLPEKIDVSDGSYAWNTAEVDQWGSPKFPDGLYTITVTAFDFAGNSSSASDTVLVNNTNPIPVQGNKKKKGKIRR